MYMCFLEFFEEGSSVFVTVYCIFLITRLRNQVCDVLCLKTSIFHFYFLLHLFTYCRFDFQGTSTRYRVKYHLHVGTRVVDLL
jgi:hypothetical protein